MFPLAEPKAPIVHNGHRLRPHASYSHIYFLQGSGVKAPGSGVAPCAPGGSRAPWASRKKTAGRRDDSRLWLGESQGRYWRPESPKSDDDFDELLNEKNEAPDPLSPEAIKEFGRVAELEVPARSEQHPFRFPSNPRRY